MPDLPEPKRRKYQPKKKAHANNKGYPSYNDPTWRMLSGAIRRAQPVCEIAFALGETMPSEQTDHIIPVIFNDKGKPTDQGGSFWDKRNLMALSRHYHHKKTGMQSRMLIEAMRGDGGLVPVDRAQVFAYFVEDELNQ